ncbi:MAG TPA: CHAP domain-containing protein [Solirubrobacteraceae bacterium]|nr:CHAP domain-containing protein [Solirubrobacteraceae bacterium]
MSGQDAIERVAEVTGAAAPPQGSLSPYPLSGAAPGAATAASGTQPATAPESPTASAQVASFAAALSEAEMAMLAQSSMAALAQGGEGVGASSAGSTLALLTDELQSLISTLPGALAQGACLQAPAGASASGSLAPAGALSGISAGAPAGALAASGPEALRERIVHIAEGQAGQHEEPMGSNEGAAVAMYRGATRGAIPGAPWCAYFVSWVARQAGEPIGSEGQGLGAVSEIWEWAQQSGRAIPNGPGVVPKPGDLIVFGDEHVGIVRGVLPNGQIETVEGNYENKVALNVRSPSEPTGYVEMG